MFESGDKQPQKIINQLIKNNIEPLSKIHLNNYLSYYKISQYGSTQISLGIYNLIKKINIYNIHMSTDLFGGCTIVNTYVDFKSINTASFF